MSKREEIEQEVESKFCVYLGENKKWRITADPYNFILSKKVEVKGKTPYYKVDSYYQNLAHLLESVGNKNLRERDIKSMNALLKELRLIKEELAAYARVIIS